VSGFRETVAECLAAGERVDVHFWFDRRELCWRMKTPEPMPPEERIYLIEATDRDGAVQSYVDPARLLRMPLARARELLEQARGFDLGELDRDGIEVRDALERALRKPERFGVDAYGPFDDMPRARAQSLESQLAQWPDASKPHVLPPLDWQDQLRRRPDNDNGDHEALLEQVGMRVDESGYHLTPPEPGLEHWVEQLRELEHGPTYVHGVPVRRLPCVPMRFEVGCYELSACTGLGTGARQRITKVMSLWEAAAFVRFGKCPHYKYSATSDRWTETA
jgi:hypothetical protein